MDLALSDVNADWLDLADAQGVAHDEQLVELRILVRPDSIRGPLPVEPLETADADGRNLTVEAVDAVRDEDGSLDEGRLTRGDLARLRLDLGVPVPEDARATVELRHPHGPPITWGYVTPGDLDDGVNELYSGR